MLSHSPGLVTLSSESRKGVLQQHKTGNQERSSCGPRHRDPAQGAASGRLQTGGDGAPGVGVPGREHDRELGKGEDKRNAIDVRKAQIWEN